MGRMAGSGIHQPIFQDVEDDCTEAFNMDNRYIKAYSRDGTLIDENVTEVMKYSMVDITNRSTCYDCMILFYHS
ncbi:hypothetical protein CsatA_020008 [Cannabis sativa]